ncbi:MAG: hypothetical protein K6G88_06820 [Lachnospiraceae bacterium]|nr:hypothetical protein [Lachnospiraceae bacterium]
MSKIVKRHLRVALGLFAFVLLFCIPMDCHATTYNTDQVELTFNGLNENGKIPKDAYGDQIKQCKEDKNGDHGDNVLRFCVTTGTMYGEKEKLYHYYMQKNKESVEMILYKNGNKVTPTVTGHFEMGDELYPCWYFTVAYNNPSGISKYEDLKNYSAKVIISNAPKQECDVTVEKDTKAESCEYPGWYIRSCSKCNGVHEIMRTKAHTYEWETIDPADCVNEGTKAKKCVVCGDIEEYKQIDPLGHQFEKKDVRWHIQTVPSCSTQKAIAIFPCKYCGYEEYKEISVTPTINQTWSCTKGERITAVFSASVRSQRNNKTITSTNEEYTNVLCEDASSQTIDGVTYTLAHAGPKQHNYPTSSVSWGKATYKCGTGSTRTATFTCTEPGCSEYVTVNASSTSNVTRIQSCTRDELITATFTASTNNPRTGRTTTVTQTDAGQICVNHKAKGHKWLWVIDQDLTCTQDYKGHQHCFQTTDTATYNGKSVKGQECHNINGSQSETDKTDINTVTKVLESAPGHHFEELKIDKYATCTEDGVAYYQCTNTINGVRCTATNSVANVFGSR